MSKRISVASIFILLVASVIMQTGFTETPQKKKLTSVNEAREIKEYRDPWRLRSRNKDGVRDEIVSWANVHFTLPQGSTFGDDKDLVKPLLPLKLVKSVEFSVIPVPEWRHVEGYEESKAPTYHAVCLLRDGRGDLYNVVVESYDPNREKFVIHSVGPVLDRTPEATDLPIEKRRLKTWPTENTTIRPSHIKGKPVIIPYPYSMNQYYFQYGDDPVTATFISINSGKYYQGLETILSDVDATWQSLR
jgi:hypothetical protein